MILYNFQVFIYSVFFPSCVVYNFYNTNLNIYLYAF